MILTSESKGRIFTQYGADPFNVWIIETSSGLFRRIKNLVTTRYLEANIKGDVFSNILRTNSKGQEWTIFDGIITNREYNTVLYADLNGEPSAKKLTDSLLARWKIINSSKDFDVPINRNQTPLESNKN
jgi:hypothetical protein